MRSWILELFITLSIIQVCRAPWACKKYSLGPPENPKNPNLGCHGKFKSLTPDGNGPEPTSEDNEIRPVATPSPPHNHHHCHHHHHHHPRHRGSYGLSCLGGSSSDNEVEESNHCDCGKKNKHKKSKTGKSTGKNSKGKKGKQPEERNENYTPPFPYTRTLFAR